MVAAAKSIASEIAGEALPGSRARPRALVVEGREVCALQVIDGSRAAEVLDKDPHEFGAMVRRLYLSGPAGGNPRTSLKLTRKRLPGSLSEPFSGAGWGGPQKTLKIVTNKPEWPQNT